MKVDVGVAICCWTSAVDATVEASLDGSVDGSALLLDILLSGLKALERCFAADCCLRVRLNFVAEGLVAVEGTGAIKLGERVVDIGGWS